MYCFIISPNPEFTTQLKTLLSKTHIQPVSIDFTVDNIKVTIDYSDRLTVFNQISNAIEEKIQDCRIVNIRESIVIVDEIVKWIELNPISFANAYNKERVYAMLGLAFPELKFIFLNNTDWNGKNHFFEWLDEITLLQDIATKNHVNIEISLFDPNGFRNTIRESLSISEKSDASHKLLTRNPLALSVDEEQYYAYFHAYIAYKMGYRSHIAVLKDQLAYLSKKAPEINLQFEDLFLNFPDKDSKEHYTNLCDRSEAFPFLDKAEQRFIITVGHKKPKVNKECKHKHRYTILYKPSQGMFNVIEECKLLEKYYEKERNRLKIYGILDKPDDNLSDHSAPGILLLIAEKLLSRSQNILDNVSSVPDALHAALLAMEAKEILGGKTPTLTLAALAQQQKAEVIAESMFFGVKYNFKVEERFKEIELETEAISHWFNPETSKQQMLNAQLKIAHILSKTFHDFSQFEEEILCLQKALRIQFKSWRGKPKRPFNKLARPFHWYLRISLSSIGFFCGFILLWTIFFAVIYFLRSGEYTPCNLLDSWIAATRFFFTLTLNENSTSHHESWTEIFNKNIWGSLILAFQGVVSFSNLSLLVSNLYLKISRR